MVPSQSPGGNFNASRTWWLHHPSGPVSHLGSSGIVWDLRFSDGFGDLRDIMGGVLLHLCHIHHHLHHTLLFLLPQFLAGSDGAQRGASVPPYHRQSEAASAKRTFRPSSSAHRLDSPAASIVPDALVPTRGCFSVPEQNWLIVDVRSNRAF